MPAKQTDLFAALEPPAPPAPPPDPALVEAKRAWLREKLAWVKSLDVWPWPEDKSSEAYALDREFKYAVTLLPEAEGAALWAEFDPAFERLWDIDALAHEEKVGHLPLPDNAKEYAEELLRARPGKKLPPWAKHIPEYAHLALTAAPPPLRG
jgi:hypothetical protein